MKLIRIIYLKMNGMGGWFDDFILCVMNIKKDLTNR